MWRISPDGATWRLERGGDLAIVSGTVEPIGEDSDQEYFLQVGTITP